MVNGGERSELRPSCSGDERIIEVGNVRATLPIKRFSSNLALDSEGKLVRMPRRMPDTFPSRQPR